MCNENLIELLNIDFGSDNDHLNWVHNSSNVFYTFGDYLVFEPSSSSTVYTRNISPTTTNNRIRIKLNFKVLRTESVGTDNMDVVFQMYNNGTVIEESCVSFKDMLLGVEYFHFLDRTYEIGPLTSQLSIKINVPIGWENIIYMEDLIVEDYNYCSDKVRTYFAMEDLLQNSLIAQSGTIDLISWKVDGQETLTPEFFAENIGSDKVPKDTWNFAKADLDGTDRVADILMPNSFNPFIAEWGLDYDISNYYSGKPIGTLSGSDYGTGILQIGFQNPCILNCNLEEKRAAFFIDIDYNVSLRVEFQVVLNFESNQTFKWPNQNRKYIIEWNADTCTKSFYYDFNDENGVINMVDQIQNGFLYGLTPTKQMNIVVPCDKAFDPAGNFGTFVYQLDFGTGTGLAGINYNAYSVPDRFIMEWNGQTYDSGYRGDAARNNDLIAAGVDPADINTAFPPNGSGQLTFNKTSATPTMATITVLAPLPGTAWLVTGICPS